ncbi:MAG: uracil-DNA glycosylase [Polyangiales bacterium]
MTAPTRDELAELTRLFAAHAAWQRDLGAVAFPRRGALPVPDITDAEPVVDAPVPVVAAPAVASAPAPVEPAPSLAPTPPAPAPRVAPPAPVSAPPRPAARPARSVSLTMFDEAPRAVTAASMPLLEGDARREALEVVRGEVARCEGCRLSTTRTQTVFSRGDVFARLAFVGEGPGEQEDLRGLPFVGPAGQLLDKIIAGMGLSPDEVYVANIVKCRPPNNRVPQEDEMRACTPFLVRQLGLVKPEVVVALGKTAASYLLQSKASMGSLRGKWHAWEGVAVMPTWHPSYVLRDARNPGSTARRDVWEDMKLVLARLDLPVPEPRRR